MTATELHATRLAEAQARIAAEAARRGPAAAKALSDRMERESDVAAALAAVPDRIERRYRWSCARCAEPMRTTERPPTPQLCARCRPERLEAHTEPATRPVYGDESEDDGAPIALPASERTTPAPRERIQADTPPRAPEVTEERAVTVTATKEPPAKATPKKADAPTTCPNPKCGAPVVQTGHGRRAIYCSKRCKGAVRYARAREREKAAMPKAAGPFSCSRCAHTFETERKRNGHLAWCGKKRGETSAPAPTLTSGGTVSIRLPDLRAVVVRLPGGVQVELPSARDAAEFVRAVGAAGRLPTSA